MVQEMKRQFKKINSVKGELSFAGDKSISHRAIFFSSMAEGKSVIKNISSSEDVKSTQKVFSDLGVDFFVNGSEFIVKGKGKKKFNAPLKNLDCGNSGTTARLLAGLLIAQNFSSTIIGDESLSQRPMKRIIEPLRLMGGKIESSDSTLPIRIHPTDSLKAIEYNLPVPSAQVKSSVLIAGLHIEDETKVIEHSITRDHTERMLGLPVQYFETKKIISASEKLYPVEKEYFVPGDISSAAFFIVLALLTKNSELVVKDVSLNPSRTGFIELLRRMNAIIKVENVRDSSNEPFGDLVVCSSDLKNVLIEKEIIPNIIDEIPILSVAGIFAEGVFEIRNCEELRYKESDRIKAICENLKLLGLDIEEFKDGFRVSGKIKNTNINFHSFNDHRIAMAFSVLASILGDKITVEGTECVVISNPDFYEQINKVSAN
jgi:3-phosphoshikimate 1-carboxyvinyltransferase